MREMFPGKCIVCNLTTYDVCVRCSKFRCGTHTRDFCQATFDANDNRLKTDPVSPNGHESMDLL